MLRFQSLEKVRQTVVVAAPIDSLHASTRVDTTPEEKRIALFLDEIIHGLAALPADLHHGVRAEMRAHLDSLIAAHEELGATREEAVPAAIRQFGDSKRIARRFRQAWQSTNGCESVNSAIERGLATFTAAMGVTIAYVITLSHFVLYPHHRSLAESLFSDLCWYVVFGLPILGGVWMGWKAPRRAASGAFWALAILTLVSVPFVWIESSGRLAALPWLVRLAISTAAHLFALWLPIGGIAALLARVAKQRRDRRITGRIGA